MLYNLTYLVFANFMFVLQRLNWLKDELATKGKGGGGVGGGGGGGGNLASTNVIDNRIIHEKTIAVIIHHSLLIFYLNKTYLLKCNKIFIFYL